MAKYLMRPKLLQRIELTHTQPIEHVWGELIQMSRTFELKLLFSTERGRLVYMLCFVITIKGP